MKVALIGASGNVGSRILAELLGRGHEVTGIVRHPEKLPAHEGLTAKRGDVNDESGLAQILAGHDAVISSVKFRSMDRRSLIEALNRAGVKRLIVVGGAGSLEVAPNMQLVDTPDFPDGYKPEALAGRDFLNVLRGERELDWTFLSPSALFVPGKRTGKFRLGTDRLLVGANGESKISFEDYAIALVDELETARHSRQRFTVGNW
ncbi:MAG TPA: NAD(P)-dependent oxidoreductase [Pyrinomonadaceae bacterium]